MAGLKNLGVRVYADTKDFSRSMKSVKGEFQTINRTIQKNGGNMARLVGQNSGLMSALAGASTTAAIASATQFAIQTDAALGQVNFLLGENAQSFVDWASTQGKAYGLAKSESIRFGAIYSNLVSTFAQDTEQAMTMTQDLLKASAITASASGREMTDVMERIRSGMLGNTEAVEDLGVNVYTSALEQTDAFKRLGQGAKNWDSIQSFSLKQQIRYYAILEQIQKRYGTELRDNVATRVLLFKNSMLDLKTAIGSAVIPALNALLPILTRMAEAVTRVFLAIAQFTGAIFGYDGKAQAKSVAQETKAWEEYSDAISDTNKEVKQLLGGFDEINTLDTSKATDTSKIKLPQVSSDGWLGQIVGNAKLFDPSLKIQEIITNVKKEIDKLDTSKFEKSWSILQEAFSSDPFRKGMDEDSAKKLNEKIKKDFELLVQGLIDTGAGLAQAFGGIIQVVNGFFIVFTNMFSGKKGQKEAFRGTKMMEEGFKNIGDSFYTLFDGLSESLLGAESDSKKATDGALNGIFGNVAKDLSDEWNRTFNSKDGISTKLKNFGKEMWTSLKNGFTSSKVSLGVVADDIGTLSDSTKKKLKEVGTSVWNSIKSGFGNVGTWFDGIVNAMIDSTNKLIDGMNKIKYKAPNWVPFIGGKSWGIDLPKVPKLAKGGIVDSPTIAMVGEAGKEAVMPLENNTGWITDLASKLNAQSSSGDIVINIGGTTLARITAEEMNRLNRQAGRTVLNV